MTYFEYLDFYIDNPVLVNIFIKYRDFFEEEYGFAFEKSEETGNIVMSYSEDEAPVVNVPTSLKTAAEDFVRYNRFDFFKDEDAMCDDLLNMIEAHSEEINKSYQKLLISYRCNGDEHPDTLHCWELRYEDGQESYEEYEDDM